MFFYQITLRCVLIVHRQTICCLDIPFLIALQDTDNPSMQRRLFLSKIRFTKYEGYVQILYSFFLFFAFSCFYFTSGSMQWDNLSKIHGLKTISSFSNIFFLASIYRNFSTPSLFHTHLSPRFSTPVHPLLIRQTALGIGVGSYKYISGKFSLMASVAACAL